MALTVPLLLDQPHTQETAYKPRPLSPGNSRSLSDTPAGAEAARSTDRRRWTNLFCSDQSSRGPV